MSTELSIVRPENVQMIAQNAPKIYNENQQRSVRCTNAGAQLLSEIKEKGMSDELDQRCAAYLEKSRKTVKLMNEQRSPITKMFDQIRTEFTGMENSIDPTKAGNVPNQIQAFRNQFAAKKREEEEKRRREEAIKLQKQQALTKYETDVEDDFRQLFSRYITQRINELTTLNTSLTLENFDTQSVKIVDYPTAMPADLFNHLTLSVLIPQILSTDEAAKIRASVQSRLLTQFNEQYTTEIGDYKDTIVDALNSKHAELERMAKANAEEQERMKQELAAKEAAEAARLEAERKRKEDEAKAAKEMQSQAQEVGNLFDSASVSTPAYTPKTSVKKKIVALDAEGIINIVSFWWSKDGQYMSVDDLTKMFKKQITAVEKYANDKANAEFINSPHVKYEDEVKAK